jgi:hypothetical protein
MGLISKQVNQARTNKQLAPVTAVTTLADSMVFAVAQAVVDAYVPKRLPNPKLNVKGDARLWLDPSPEPHSRFVVCQSPLLKDPDHHGDSKRAEWLSQLTIVDASTQRLVQLLFLRGRTTDGLLQELKLYTQFRDRFLETMQREDPGFRVLDLAQGPFPGEPSRNHEKPPHRSRVTAALVDVPAERYREAIQFWSGALGSEPEIDGEDPSYTNIGEPVPGLQFIVQQVDSNARIHFDIETDDVAVEIERLEALGAERVENIESWWVMRDPAGLLFCVVRVQDAAAFERGAHTWE